MATCVTKRRKDTGVCIGHMNKRITIYIRELTAPQGNGVDYRETFASPKIVWAMLDTPKNKTMFDATGIVKDITHDFYIRYIPNIYIDRAIEFQSDFALNPNYYSIINIRNFGENSDFLMISTTIRGDNTLAAARV